MKKFLICALSVVALCSACSSGPKDGEYELHLYTTGDVHGSYFDSTYVNDKIQTSLFAVSQYINDVRNEVGKDKVILVDAGDCIQGNNASYYYNYVDTTTKHVYARMVEYMKYDAVVVGNHDIETGHAVYDRLRREMKVPLLAANALRTDNGKPYFQDYVIVKRQGLKVAIIGMTNPNMKNWLSEELWSGMQFDSLLPYAQEYVDKVRARENPQVVILVIHAGTGLGDGSSLESQGLDLFQTIRGVDFLVCAHDHRPYIARSDSLCLINGGSHCRCMGHGTINLTIEDGKCVAKTLDAEVLPMDEARVDTVMRDLFRPDYEAVKAFTLKPVGELKADLEITDSYRGMSDYMNLLHAVSLRGAPARISFAAPLTFRGRVESGTLLYNDLFKIYPYENQLFVVKMTGAEIKNYLEYSYNGWINTVSGKKDEHVLKITAGDDPRNQQKRYSFISRSYNFDSAAGINYTVDVTKPFGNRVTITTLADGSAFSADAEYNVAMTSYRASGGGNLMRDGAGIDTDKIDERIVARYPAIRDMLYDYILENGGADPAVFGDPAILGSWSFIPASLADSMLSRDLDLLF